MTRIFRLTSNADQADDTRAVAPGNAVAYIDPGTLQVIIAAASFVLSFIGRMNDEEAKRNVAKQLDTLIGMCIEILEQLKNMRIVIREELEQAFRNDDIRELSALRKSAHDAIAGVSNPNRIPEPVREQLALLFDRIKTKTYELQEYGYATYAAVAAGALLSLQIGILLKIEKATLISVLDQMRKYFADALIAAPGRVPETVKTTLDRTILEETGLWQYITQFPRNGWLGYTTITEVHNGPDGPEYTEILAAYYLRLTGEPPADIPARMGFRYGAGDPELDEGRDRGWPHFPDLIPGMSSAIGHFDGAMDGRATVLRHIASKGEARDDSWTRKTGLETVLDNITLFIDQLDQIRARL